MLTIAGAMNSELLKEKISEKINLAFPRIVELVENAIRTEIEKVVDKLKTDAKDIPVVACGGGAFLLPNKIDGASEVIFPEHLEVANAFGACIAQFSSEEELVINTAEVDEQAEMEKLLVKVESKLLENGVTQDSINILLKESMPLAYLPGVFKLKVKLCGDLETN